MIKNKKNISLMVNRAPNYKKRAGAGKNAKLRAQNSKIPYKALTRLARDITHSNRGEQKITVS